MLLLFIQRKLEVYFYRIIIIIKQADLLFSDDLYISSFHGQETIQRLIDQIYRRTDVR